MKKLRNIILFGLILGASGLHAMEPVQAPQSVPTSLKVGLYGSPTSVNFIVIKKYIDKLTPEDLTELNDYDEILDGTLLDIVEDRKKNFPGYENEYNEIIRLLKEKGALTSVARQYSQENPSTKL